MIELALVVLVAALIFGGIAMGARRRGSSGWGFDTVAPWLFADPRESGRGSHSHHDDADSHSHDGDDHGGSDAGGGDDGAGDGGGGGGD